MGLSTSKQQSPPGLKIDDFAPRLSFFFGIGMDLFMNVAMLRAARYLWSEAVSGLGAQDPYNNVIRTTIDHCAHPMYRDYLHRYLENAPGGHIHHDLQQYAEASWRYNDDF
ncbi:C-terminal part of methylmalonyl-CoA mutase [Escherichia coli]|nr:C-terminal part of methylmalonyl-CoA mutase [Escherichia coli]